MTPLTELKKLAELQGKATEGPWVQDFSGNGQVTVHDMTYFNRHVAYMPLDAMPEGEQEANAEYIAASRNIDLPALVAYVESLQNDIGKLVIQRESFKEGLKSIAEMPEEENEWDAVDKYDECRVRAKKALEDIEPIVRENEVFE